LGREGGVIKVRPILERNNIIKTLLYHFLTLWIGYSIDILEVLSSDLGQDTSCPD
jgi:hypothetical protein